jgi:hypothetical protein
MILVCSQAGGYFVVYRTQELGLAKYDSRNMYSIRGNIQMLLIIRPFVNVHFPALGILRCAKFFVLVSWGGVRLSPLGTSATICPIVPDPDDRWYECGAVGGMKIGRGNRITRRKPAPVPLCPPQIPHDLTRDRSQAAEMGSRCLTVISDVSRILQSAILSWCQRSSQTSVFFSSIFWDSFLESHQN